VGFSFQAEGLPSLPATAARLSAFVLIDRRKWREKE